MRQLLTTSYYDGRTGGHKTKLWSGDSETADSGLDRGVKGNWEYQINRCLRRINKNYLTEVNEKFLTIRSVKTYYKNLQLYKAKEDDWENYPLLSWEKCDK